MIRPNPLQQLRDLDSTSPHFHKQLSNCLRGSEYQSAVPTLQDEDLVWLVEYLDGVSLQSVPLHSTLNAGVGSCRQFRSCESHVPGMLARTQKYMWC